MKRLLLFEFHLLGDAVMSLPFLRAAAERYEVHVCCSPAAAKLYELILPAGQVHRTPPRETLSVTNLVATVRARTDLKKLRADVAVTVWADARVHATMMLLKIPERIGFPMNRTNYYAHHVEWRENNLRKGEAAQRVMAGFGRRLLTTALQRDDYRQHHVADWVQLAGALGLVLDVERPWLELDAFPLPVAAQEFFQRNAGRKIWLLHPGAAKPTKQWPHFAAVARDFFGRHEIPLVILEDPAVARIEAPHENCLVWSMSSLADFIALVGACDFVLCNDSAASHFGAALKKHVVTIFGSGSSDWFAPYGTARTVIESSVCPYRPCFDRCLQPSILCLEDISLERVVGELEKLRGN